MYSNNMYRFIISEESKKETDSGTKNPPLHTREGLFVRSFIGQEKPRSMSSSLPRRQVGALCTGLGGFGSFPKQWQTVRWM